MTKTTAVRGSRKGFFWQANGVGPKFAVVRREGDRVLIQDGKRHSWVVLFKADKYGPCGK